MTKKLRWGVLGTGWIAQVFVRELGASRTGTLAAVASRDLRRAQRLTRPFPGARAYGNYEELLLDPLVDIVYVALPNHLHTEWTVRSAAHGKHILCEKPLGIDHAEAMSSVAAAKEHDVFLMEGLMYRLHPQTERLGRLIRDRVIGDVRVVQTAFGGRVPPSQDNIRLRYETAGGGILDTGTYCLSMARYIAGASIGQPVAEPTELVAIGHIGDRTRVDESSCATMRFPGDIVVSAICSNQVDLDWTLRISGTAGQILVPDPWMAGKDLLPGRILVRTGNDEEDIVLPTDRPIYAIEADAIAESIALREIQPPGMTWADSLSNMEALDTWRQLIGLDFGKHQESAPDHWPNGPSVQ
jgi:predicted dehydrogenase